MKSFHIKWVILAFIVFLSISLMINIPVKQVFWVVDLPEKLHVHNLSGSIMNVGIESLSYQGYQITDVEVNFSASCLLSLTICYSIQSDDYALTALVVFNPLNQSLAIRDSQATFEGDFFNQFPQLIVKPKGEFLLNIDHASFQFQKLTDLRIRINWMNAGIEGEDQSLGSYLANIYTQKDVLKVELKDEEALLTANGNIDIFQDGAYATQISLESQAGLKSSIKNALTLFAKPAGLGKYHFSSKGRLSNNNKMLLNNIDLSKSKG